MADKHLELSRNSWVSRERNFTTYTVGIHYIFLRENVNPWANLSGYSVDCTAILTHGDNLIRSRWVNNNCSVV